MSKNQEGVCFSEIRSLQGAMLAAKNIYQDNDNLGNMQELIDYLIMGLRESKLSFLAYEEATKRGTCSGHD